MCQGVAMTPPHKRRATRRLAASAVVGVLTVPALTGCFGGSGDSDTPECAPADEAMETAKERIDDTSGLTISLATNDEPSGAAVTSADVDIVRPESFEGTFTGQMFGATADGEIIGVGEDLWVILPPLYSDWTEFDPDSFGVEVPALGALLGGDGLSSLLVGTDGLGDPRAERDENDTSVVLCYYEGTLAADEIAKVIPSASGEDFGVEYAIDGDGALRKATMTGDFYGNDEELTYVLDVVEYDVDKDIQPPA
jgi:lipoprotein LprG